MRVVFAREGERGYVSWSMNLEVGMTLNGLFCADVLRPLDLVHITDFTYRVRFI